MHCRSGLRDVIASIWCEVLSISSLESSTVPWDVLFGRCLARWREVQKKTWIHMNPHEYVWIHIYHIYIKHVIHLYPFHVCSEICPPFFTNPSWFCLSIGVCLSWVSQGSHQHHVWCSIGCLPPWSIPGSQRKTNPANCQDGHSPEKHLSFMLSSKIGMDSLPRDCKKEWFIISEMLHIEQI